MADRKPCMHLRGPAGRSVRCPAACPACHHQGRQVLYSCDLGRLCVPVGLVDGVTCCAWCPWYMPGDGQR